MNYLATLPIVAFILILLPGATLAFCPVCVIATGAFAGIFRWLGVDDAIVGLWLGGFVLALSITLSNYLSKKIKTPKPLISAAVLAASYGLTLSVLIWDGFFDPHSKIFGIYKIIFGGTLGSLLVFSAPFLDKILRKRNGEKMFISHQKVLIAVSLLFVFSLILYILLKI